MAFASEAELGFDKSIARVYEKVPKKKGNRRAEDPEAATEDRATYNIRCGGKWYRVLKTLSDNRAAHILGRATRVWKVQEIQDTLLVDGPQPTYTLVGNPLVIKDVWIDRDSKSEGEILEDVISKINKVNPIDEFDVGPEEEEVVEKLVGEHFVSIGVDEVVQIGDTADDGSLEDDTTATILHGLGLPMEANALRMTKAGLETRMHHGYGAPRSVSAQSDLNSGLAQLNLSEDGLLPLKPRALVSKQHRRILYSEYGRPLDHAEIMLKHNLYFKSLAKAVTGESFNRPATWPCTTVFCFFFRTRTSVIIN